MVIMSTFERVNLMKIMRLNEVIVQTGLSRSTIYVRITEGSFPKSISLGGNAVGWVEKEIIDWILQKIDERDNAIN